MPNPVDPDDITTFLRIDPSKGGRARAEKLTPAQRSAIAKQAATARWQKNVPAATHDGVLDLSGTRLICAVLADGTRLIRQGDIMDALGRDSSTGRRESRNELPPFLASANLLPFITKDLREHLHPIEFRIGGQRFLSTGFDATILPEICDVYLAARADPDVRLTKKQLEYAGNAETLMRSLAKVGIVALVDEATGYQNVRERQELQRLLAEYVEESFRPWVKRFPEEFFTQVMRIYGHEHAMKGNRRPQFIGRFINEYVYRRFPEGVLDELQRLNPVNEAGSRSRSHHQHLTQGTGNVHLDRQIVTVVTLMSISRNAQEFKDFFATRFPGKREVLRVTSSDDGDLVKLFELEDFE
ncbi:hypothetical protein E3T26_14515 [Cryobacterium sp. TMT1-21]|uniref:P63C domain-containing protein n=1 Tax=Cryobacterium sp. TMT1-21 TaxID=1259234 RepID=UPI00106BB513|nr:P63C domain-containing protein [Cryobacterium sp. TMT1-21]TFD09836.1 hypothetical protein E3T26_14515 [Cryobacterium sp. TMT1-21]